MGEINIKKINIILPVYNEAEVIENFNTELFKVIDPLGDKYLFDIIYVLDKGNDNTIDILKKICNERSSVKLLALSRRFGHQLSLVAGMDKCTGDAVIMMDSDLEHPPALIPLLLEKFELGYNIVNTKREYNRETSFLKKITSRLFYKFLSKICLVDINEDCADFRLISNKVLKIFQNNIREQNQFLRGLFPWVGFNQTFITFISARRKKGKSKYNLFRLINFGIAGIISFSKIPLKISILSGLLISFISILYGFYGILNYIINKELPHGWTSLIATISFLGSFQLIILGIIGEYIGAIFDEVKNRPLYIIEEEYTKRETEEQK